MSPLNPLSVAPCITPSNPCGLGAVIPREITVLVVAVHGIESPTWAGMHAAVFAAHSRTAVWLNISLHSTDQYGLVWFSRKQYGLVHALVARVAIPRPRPAVKLRHATPPMTSPVLCPWRVPVRHACSE